MADPRAIFAEIADTGMASNGFEKVKASLGDAAVIEYTKLGRPAYVTASESECAMNNDQQRMTSLCKARVKNAITTWKANG